jgi:DNA-binding NtrC family response regulator
VSASILVIDDDPSVRETLVEFFETFLWTAVGAGTAAEARQALGTHPPDVVLLDLRLPDTDGIRFLDALREEWPDIAVVVLTGYADIPTTVRSMQRGAIDLLEKPVDLDVLAATVRRAIALSRLRREVEVMRARTVAVPDALRVAVAPAIEPALLAAAASARPVLLLGEAGSGRGDLARWVHHCSDRSAGAFVDLDCGAHTADSFANELYGHTVLPTHGTRRVARGLLEIAAEGSVLIERLERLPAESSVEFRKVFEDNVFRRSAGGRLQMVTARLLLTADPSSPGFADLPPELRHPRDAEVIQVPSLRERTTELGEVARRVAPPDAQLSEEALAAIRRYSWPGNLRELRLTLWRAALLAEGGPIRSRHLLLPAVRGDEELGTPLAEWERVAIVAALSEVGGNRSRAARRLGIARSTLHLKLKRLGLSDYRTDRE